MGCGCNNRLARLMFRWGWVRTHGMWTYQKHALPDYMIQRYHFWMFWLVFTIYLRDWVKGVTQDEEAGREEGTTAFDTDER